MQDQSRHNSIYEFILSSSQFGVWEWPDLEKPEQIWNKSMYDVLQTNPQITTSNINSFIELLNRDDVAKFHQFIEEAKEIKDEPYFLEIRIRIKDGLYKWVKMSGTYKFNSDGKPIYMAGILYDINQRKLIDEELKQKIKLLSTAEKMSKFGTFRYRRGEKAIWLSEGAREIYGWHSDRDFTFNHLQDMTFEEDWEKIATRRDSISQSVSSNKLSYRIRVDDQTKYCEAKSIYVGNENDKDSFVGVIHDLTEEHHRSEELDSLIGDLKRSNAELEQFAYVASHDLQEPLRKIQTFAERLVLKSVELPEREQNYIQRMQKSALRMQTLIKDLLDFSRASRVKVEADEVDLNVVLKDLIADLSDQIEQREVQLEVDNLPVVYGNSGQLYRLFQNLISNSIKFSKKEITPKIEINYTLKSRKEIQSYGFQNILYNAYYNIEVKDNGIGFDEKYLDKVFTIFQRLHGRSEYEGTGIGLAISDKIVSNHGGFLTAKSKLERGSTFFIFLPVQN